MSVPADQIDNDEWLALAAELLAQARPTQYSRLGAASFDPVTRAPIDPVDGDSETVQAICMPISTSFTRVLDEDLLAGAKELQMLYLYPKAWVPQKGDVWTDNGGNAWTVQQAVRIAPDGVVLLWTLALSR